MASQEEIAKVAAGIADPQRRAQYLRDQGIGLPRVVDTMFPPLGPDSLPEGPGSDQAVNIDLPDDQPVDISGNVLGHTENEETRNQRLTQAAAIKSDLDGQDIAEAYEELEQANPSLPASEILRQQSQRANVEKIRSLYEQALDFGVGGDPAARVAAVAELVEEDQKRQTEFDGDAFNLVRALASPFAEPNVIEQEAVILGFMQELQAYADSISFGESMRDLGLDILPFKFLFDNFQVTGKINPFTAKEAMQSMIINFKRMSPDEQKRMFPIIKAELEEILPRGRVLSILTAMVNPSQSEQDVLLDFGTFAVVDIVLSALGILGVLKGIAKSRNLIKLAKKLGDEPKAAELNTRVLVDETGEVGKKLDVDKLQAHDNALPFVTDDLDDVIAREMAPSAQAVLKGFKDQVRNTATNLQSGKFFIREGMIDDQDRRKIIKAIDEQFEDEIARELTENGRILTVTAKRSDPDGIIYEFKVATPLDEGGELIEEVGTFERKFTFDDIGHARQIDPGFLPEWFKSPKLRASGTDFEAMTDGAIRLDFAAMVVSTQLRMLSAQINKGIKGGFLTKKRKVRDVDAVLIYGDDAGKVYTPAELRAGVNGYRLADDQIVAYYKTTDLYGGLFSIYNGETRRLMAARNVKSIKISDSKTHGLKLGQVYDTPRDAERALSSNAEVGRVYDKATGRSIQLKDLDLNKAYGDGKLLVKLEDTAGFKGKGGGIFQHVLVHVDDIGPLPVEVLMRNVGYVPRGNPRAMYFVQKFTPTTVDGLVRNQRSVVRAFDNRKEAKEFADRLTDEAAALREAEVGLPSAQKTAPPENTTFRAAEDREIERATPGETGLSSTGGLIYGPRRKEKVPFGLPEQQLDSKLGDKLRRGAFESLALYSENVNKFVTRNEWRIGARRKWEKTAEEIFKERDKIDFDSFNPTNDTSAGRFLNSWRNQINEWSGFNSKAEDWWDAIVQQVIEASVGKKIFGLDVNTSYLHTIRHKDPAAALRSAAFHTLLGAYNPIQIFVQAQGASVAMSVLNPLKLPGTLRRQIGLRFIQHIDTSNVKAFKRVAKLTGWSTRNLITAKKVWDKTGLFDSMLINADVEAAIRGYPTTAGAIRRTFDRGLMFYREGEGFNRRMAFLTSLEEVGFDKLDDLLRNDDLMRKLLTRSSDLMLNLGKANRASFQKGLSGTITQFLQVVTKTMEAIIIPLIPGINRRGSQQFTPKERMKIFTGQIAMYGAAGIPLGNLGLRAAMDLFGVTQDDVDNKDNINIIKFLNGGIWDLFTFAVMGADIEVGKRASLIQGFNDLVISWSTDSTTPIEIFLGPWFQAPSQFWRKLQTAAPIMSSSWNALTSPHVTEKSAVEAVTVMSEFALELGLTPFSTWRNVDKARFARNLHMAVDRNGVPIAARDFKLQEEVLRGLGFEIGDVARHRDLSGQNAQRSEYVSKLASEMLVIDNHFWLKLESHRGKGTEMSQVEKDIYFMARSMIMAGVDNDGMAVDLMAAFNAKLLGQRRGNTKLDRAKNEALSNWSSDLVKEYETIINNNRLTPIRSNIQPPENN